MLPGGGKRKGSSFERAVATTLSLWVSEGARADLFCRTVLSGGAFTLSVGNENAPGDLMAQHPSAFAFTSLFLIECKHHKTIGLDKYLLDTTGNSFLSKVYALANTQAIKMGLTPLVIAKQNRYPAIVLMDYHVGAAARDVTVRRALKYHVLHSNSVVLMTLEHLTGVVSPKLFIEAVRRRATNH